MPGDQNSEEEEKLITDKKEEKEEKTEETPKESMKDKVDPIEEEKHSVEGFSIMSNAPNSHKYKLTMCQMSDPALFFKTVKNELTLLKNSLPPGIWVKGFEDRMVCI